MHYRLKDLAVTTVLLFLTFPVYAAELRTEGKKETGAKRPVDKGNSSVILLLSSTSPVPASPHPPITPLKHIAQAQKRQQRRDAALRLYKLGIQQLEKSQFREALEAFEQALAIFKQISDKEGQRGTLFYIGGVYENLRDYSKALEYYQQALAINREIKDRAGEGTILGNIGGVYENLRDYSKALEYYQQALAINREIKPWRKSGGTRGGEGTILGNIGEYPERELKLLNIIGEVYISLGQYNQALVSLSEAFKIHNVINESDPSLSATVLPTQEKVFTNLGVVCSKLVSKVESCQEAQFFFRRALAIAMNRGDKLGVGTILDKFASFNLDIGKYESDIKFYKQALAIYKSFGDKAKEANTLNNLGNLYLHLGEYNEGKEYYTQALAIFQKIDDKTGQGTTLNNLGELHRQMSKYPQALKLLNQALIIFKENKNSLGIGATLNNIGLVYNELGQYAQALRFYQDALAIRQEIDDRNGVGTTLHNTGLVYEYWGGDMRSQTLAL